MPDIEVTKSVDLHVGRAANASKGWADGAKSHAEKVISKGVPASWEVRNCNFNGLHWQRARASIRYCRVAVMVRASNQECRQ